MGTATRNVIRMEILHVRPLSFVCGTSADSAGYIKVFVIACEHPVSNRTITHTRVTCILAVVDPTDNHDLILSDDRKMRTIDLCDVAHPSPQRGVIERNDITRHGEHMTICEGDLIGVHANILARSFIFFASARASARVAHRAQVLPVGPIGSDTPQRV